MIILSEDISNRRLAYYLGVNLTIFVLVICKTNLLAANQFVTWDKVQLL
jgi:hypothetical protein